MGRLEVGPRSGSPSMKPSAQHWVASPSWLNGASQPTREQPAAPAWGSGGVQGMIIKDNEPCAQAAADPVLYRRRKAGMPASLLGLFPVFPLSTLLA